MCRTGARLVDDLREIRLHLTRRAWPHCPVLKYLPNHHTRISRVWPYCLIRLLPLFQVPSAEIAAISPSCVCAQDRRAILADR